DGEGEERRDERCALLVDVAAVEDRPHDRGVRRWTSDAPLLEGLHEARSRVPRRRARLVTLRLERRRRELLADLERRQPPLLVPLRPLPAGGGRSGPQVRRGGSRV